MVCSCCGKPKGTIEPVESNIAPGVINMVCGECRSKKFEPRHLIVIVGRSLGSNAISEYIVNHRYVGKDILAYELIT